jgi:hypothetical protein
MYDSTHVYHRIFYTKNSLKCIIDGSHVVNDQAIDINQMYYAPSEFRNIYRPWLFLWTLTIRFIKKILQLQGQVKLKISTIVNI